MFSIKSFFIATLTVSAVFFSAYAAEPNSSATMSNSMSVSGFPLTRLIGRSTWTLQVFTLPLPGNTCKKANLRKRLPN